ncbi:MAG: MBL fold metallo-hydrolase [Desulfobacterales bacterium]|nr:MBL fold metallo-hydrolase [Desulfobacterales bacterium]
MYIKCWGSRGSIPVSGEEYVKYGGDTACIEIRTKTDEIIIVDAGTGIRRLGNQIMKEKRKKINFIFTHAHWDHLMGLPFFKPLYIDNTEIIVYRCPFPNNYAEKMITKIMTPPNFPVRYSDLRAKFVYEKGCPEMFNIGSVSVIPIRLSHPNAGCGYKFIEDGKTFVFLTDNELGFIHPGGLSFDDYVEFSKGADLLIHDAEYTPNEYIRQTEWGHSDFIKTLDLAIKSGVKQLGLFHLNQDRTDNDMDAMVEICKHIIEEERLNLKCFGVAYNAVFEL